MIGDHERWLCYKRSKSLLKRLGREHIAKRQYGQGDLDHAGQKEQEEGNRKDVA